MKSSNFKEMAKALGLKHFHINQEDREKQNTDFAKKYDISKYPGMFVTADIVVLTLDSEYTPCILLIQRKSTNNYEAGQWAIPGGFVGINESSHDAAVRELYEETGVKNVHIEQFGTFDDVERDKRARIISIAYMAFVPMSKLDKIKGLDDAQDAKLFQIENAEDGALFFVNIKERFYITESDLGFDHNKIIKTALSRLDNRFTYTEDIFNFVKNKESFTIAELNYIWEAMTGEKTDPGNFRRDVIQKYLDNGIIEATGEKTIEFSKRPAAIYRKV